MLWTWIIRSYWVGVGERRRDYSEQCNHGDTVVELHVDDRVVVFHLGVTLSGGNVPNVLSD
jgi:hypothetical protein